MSVFAKQSTHIMLKTSYIYNSLTTTALYNTTIDNTNGIITNNCCSFTWKNVNLREILRGLYDKYDKFNISLVSVMTGVAGSVNTGFNERMLLVKLSGLSFINTYDQSVRQNTGEATVGVLPFSYGSFSYSFIQNENKSYHCFTKSTDYVDLKIDLKCAYNDLYPNYNQNQILGNLTFYFDIYGVDGDDK